jgi:hypothetical protein
MSTSWPSSANAVRLEITQPDPATLYEPLLDLWRRNLPTASEERCDWLYGSCRARAWLLGADNAPPTGAAGLMLRRMFVNGECVEAGGTIDLNVDQSQRSVGPALSLVRAVVGAADSERRHLLYGMPNRSATAVMKRAGFRELGEFSSWTKLLDCEQKLRGKLRSPVLARILAPAVNMSFRVLSSDWRARQPAGIVASTAARFDERFDRLSSRAANRFDVIGERSANFLNWRFCDSPDLKYQIFTLVDEQTRELAGYVVWYFDLGAVSISDMLAIDEPTTMSLLAGFSRMVRQTRSSAIRFDCFAPPDFYRLLGRAGFHRRQNRHPVLYRRSGPDDSPLGTNWYLTMADSDTDV